MYSKIGKLRSAGNTYQEGLIRWDRDKILGRRVEDIAKGKRAAEKMEHYARSVDDLWSRSGQDTRNRIGQN